LTFAEYVEHTNEKKLTNTLQLEESSNWSPLDIERIKPPFLIFLLIHTNSTYKLMRSQVPCRPTWGSKYAAMRKELELGAAP
jgi:hypothetical protein